MTEAKHPTTSLKLLGLICTESTRFAPKKGPSKNFSRVQSFTTSCSLLHTHGRVLFGFTVKQHARMPGIEVPESAVSSRAGSSFVDKFNNNEFQSDDEFSRGSKFDDDDECSSSSDDENDDDDTTHASGQTSPSNRASNEIKEMARHETTAIRRWRLITLVLILLTCAAVASGSFVYLKKQEQQDATESVSGFSFSIVVVVVLA